MSHKIQEQQLEQLLSSLPQHLAERTWLRSAGRQDHLGEGVLYWTHHALRSDENPALEVAMHLAEQLKLPLLVYQGLSEKYRFASDRHHTFILEAARDLQTAYASLGIEHVLHVDREGARNPRLAQLARSSAVVVTDDFPIEATKEWTERLADANWGPIVLVDTACVVPTRLVGKAYDRAFAFRDATDKLYRARVGREWPTCLAKPTRSSPPFPSLVLKDKSIASIVSQCQIDHSIGPVADTRGGSEAGYRRWKQFRKNGLKGYAKRRNQIEIDGVSRMSAYLHYGMVSPFRIAREAAADGAEKYLDELLIWRELSYAFCYYRKELESDASLPAWAVETLSKHRTDPKTVLSWESLARGRTGSRLWDAAQRSLIKHGELHNNVRMTWGKAILEWSNGHAQALERLIDLNHRFALDGRDPASYGGLLWCLGQFDRPFFPEQPIFGTVRTRPVAIHAERTDLHAYEKRVDRPASTPTPRIAVIGTGLAGLLCGRILMDHGLTVQSFDKSRRVGGRACTRDCGDGWRFDHGAQYFTIRDPLLQPYLNSWIQDGHVGRWNGRIVSIEPDRTVRNVAEMDRFVGTPSMQSLGQHLSDGQAVTLEAEIAQVMRGKDRYRIFSKLGNDLGEFDIVLWNCPPIQVKTMLPELCEWSSQLNDVEMLPCWAVMLALNEPWDLPWDGAFINDGSLGWMARDSSKPNRVSAKETWVLHSTVAWAKDNLNETKENVIAKLIAEAERITGSKIPGLRTSSAHRWMYSRPAQALPCKSLWDEGNRLGACGDWCGGPRVEGAIQSGISLAGRVLGSLHERKDIATQSDSDAPVQLELF